MPFCRTLCMKNQIKLLLCQHKAPDLIHIFNFSTSAKSHQVRVRFAPSPTGFLHIGGLRTALLNFLFAKSKENGKFIIRIEDTDQTRIVPGAVENLLEKLKWAGIVPDEGPLIGGSYGPYYQSERLHLYQSHAETLVKNGSAYRCFCSQRRIEILKKDQLRRKEQPRYDNRCSALSESEINKKMESGEPHVVRLRLSQGTKHFDDILFGRIEHDVASIEGDPVIMKSDGYPTYHLANVVDDHLMKITHVLRGKEWMTSTCKHISLYEAFGWKPPQFAHLPLLNNEDGKKLSKRQGDVYVEHFQDHGFFPTALLNFLCHYGAGFSEDSSTIHGDALSSPESALVEMTERFRLEKIETHDSVVRMWKLNEYNSSILKHILASDIGKQRLISDLCCLVSKKYGESNLLNRLDTEEKEKYLERALLTRQTHIVLVKDLVGEKYDYVWVRPVIGTDENCDETMMAFTDDVCRAIQDWNGNQENLVYNIRELVKKFELKMAKSMTFLRNILTGAEQGPGVGEIIYILGKSESIYRLKRATER